MTYGGYVRPVVLAGRRRRQRLGCVNEILCTVKPTSTVHGLPGSTISHPNDDHGYQTHPRLKSCSTIALLVLTLMTSGSMSRFHSELCRATRRVSLSL